MCSRAIVIAGGRDRGRCDTHPRTAGSSHPSGQAGGGLPDADDAPAEDAQLMRTILDHRGPGVAAAYFATPVATVFIVIFLVLQGALTFNLGQVLRPRDQADLQPVLHVYSLGVSAADSGHHDAALGGGTAAGHDRVAADAADHAGRRRSIGKFLAAWAFCAIALLLTFPFVIAVNILGGAGQRSDRVRVYLGCASGGGRFPRRLAPRCRRRSTRNQVIAFVLAVAICFRVRCRVQPDCQ